MLTEAMLFWTSQRLAKVHQFSVSVNGSAIKRVTEFKYLSVISVLRTTLFLTRTFVLVQPARAISCMFLL